MINKSNTGRPALLKKMNRSIILELIFKNQQISRAELAKLTGLALPSVMRRIDELIKDGLVVDIGKGVSSGGRKPNLLTLNATYRYLIGIEIAARATIILTNFKGDILKSWSSEVTTYDTPEELLEEVYFHMMRLINDFEIIPASIGGIGIGTPGTNFKYVREIPNSILKGWESIDVKSWFEEKIDIPIYVKNVARTRTLAELWFGYGKTLDDFIYVFVDQGVGCGIVRGNDIYRGHHHVAGEFGHHIVDIDGKPCYCGSKGCIEMYVSAGSIINQLLAQGYKVNHFTDVLNLDLTHHEVMKKSGDILGIGISNLINIHNPKAIIIGGMVSKSDPIFDQAQAAIQRHTFSKYALNTPIYRGKLDIEGLGSIAMVIHEIIHNLE